MKTSGGNCLLTLLLTGKQRFCGLFLEDPQQAEDRSEQMPRSGVH